jgi:hypothetical protein
MNIESRQDGNLPADGQTKMERRVTPVPEANAPPAPGRERAAGAVHSQPRRLKTVYRTTLTVTISPRANG